MKLLFDANISPDLARRLEDLYPGSSHVLSVGLGAAPTDDAIWSFAAKLGFVVVTKDADFYRLSILHGPPPKVIWLRIGNATTELVAEVIRHSQNNIARFIADPQLALLTMGNKP